MEKYKFSEEQRAVLESARVPFAIYQFIDKRVVTVVLSDGFCELFGYDDRGQAYYDPDEDKTVDDVVRRADKLMYENKWLVKRMKTEQ